MALYLIRHPAPQHVPGICYGQLDLPLAEPVTDAAHWLAQLPARFACYTSPLQRCRLLAEALQTPTLIDARLLELDFGRWEGQQWDAIGAAALDAWITSDYAADAHGGESLGALHARTAAWASDAARQPLPVVAVTHAGVIRSLLAQQHGWSTTQAFDHPLPFGSVTLLDWKPSPP
ncbi:histidine phosphatase family protein [Andreprevotia sp. IGB-42]|uniref:histidine phosphatase family protein n=1 Tax=Andreprevotia sp. IGB-42 TaxID=2497473 RepID=UPI0013582457|nr:histidine phosphatase family protein [Andreprevotia sp. IGB-42]